MKLRDSLLLPILFLVIVIGTVIAFICDDRRIDVAVREQIDGNQQEYIETLKIEEKL